MNLPAKCPNCQQLVLAPEHQKIVTLRCPSCDHHFASSSLIRLDVPMLQIVSNSSLDDSAAADQGQSREFQSATNQATKESIPQLTDVTSMQTQAATRARANSRRNPSVKLELLKVFLGGLTGIIIAQLVLWWLPSGLRRDPLQVAAHVPTWLSFVVPEELRQKKAQTPAGDLDDKPESEYKQLTGDLKLLDPLPPDSDLGNDKHFNIDGSLASSAAPVTAIPPATPPAATRLKDPPSYPASELRNLLADVRIQLEEYNDTDVDRETRRTQLRRLYQRLCEIGEVVTFVNMDDPHIGRMMQASEALLTRISNSPDQLELVGKAAGTWINYSSRVTDGITIAGEVIAIEAQDNLYFSTIRFPSKSETNIRLVCERNPITDVRQAYEVGDQVLAFGAIINEPNRKINGFSGTGPIVWEGLHIALKKTAAIAPDF